ncbi:MAG: allantoate amidohydrolase [Actinomycetales bacterium]|nr:allantoate amidohydrolase [Actinomycetales bacterium]
MTAAAPAPRGAEAARRVLERCDELARHSSMPDGIERVYLSPEHARVNDIAAAWMREAGLHSWSDPAGNQCGRRSSDPAGRPALLLGSHLDTVPGAGRYDGILGVLVAIEVADRLRETELPFALEVVAVADEEGTRFGTTLLGSRALAGSWREEWQELTDAHGTTLRRAALDFDLDPDRIASAAREPGSLVGYLEAHIEQGPRLEEADRALGVVTSIAAAERRLLTFRGQARHGATPWHLRRDALQGAAEAVLAMERLARESGSVATIGHVRVEPDAVNVVPGLAEFSLDLRDETAAGRDAAWGRIQHELQAIGLQRGLDLDVVSTHEAPEVVCAPELRDAIAAGIAATGDAEPPALFSIAGHDAMAVAAITEVGMLFVRCAGGISHHRDEAVRADDVALAIDAMEAAVLELAARRADGAGDTRPSSAIGA